ncbi:BRE1 E3 ubiquitin ligase-domain-containing protein [Dipodascopsis uninucleata]
MDDRKRLLSVKEEVDGPPSKRQITADSRDGGSSRAESATSANGFDVPLNQDDVILFKKEAIFRQMQVYKRERDLLQARVSEVEERAFYHDDHLRLIETWWDQVLDEINILSGKGVVDSDEFANVLPKSLLFANTEEYSKHLEKRRDTILQSLAPIFASLQPQSAEADLKSLYDNLSEVSSKVKVLKTENERLRDEKEDLQRRLTDATFKFMLAEKKLDRLKSSTLAKIERSSISSAVKREGSASTELKAKTEVKQETSEEKVINKAQQESDAVIRKQSDEIRSLKEKIGSMSDEISKLNIRLASLSESDVVNSVPYKSLKVRSEDLLTKVTHLESLNDVIKQENEKLSRERTEYRELVAAEYRVMADDLQNQLKKAEQDLIRIRAARDDLLQDISIRKAKEEQKSESLNEIQELAETRASRIKALELDVDRLKAQLDSTPSSKSTIQQSPEELLKQIEKLEKENQYLSAELPGIELAFNQAHAQSSRKVADLVKREEKMSRLIAEKTKADQKYFSAMRAKEAVMLENKTLKVQSQKSGEIIQQLRDADKSVTKKVSLLEKQISELESARLVYQKQLQETQRRCSEQQIASEGYKTQLDTMMNELRTRSSAITTESEARRQAEEQIERLKVELEKRKSSFNSSGSQLNGETAQMEALRSIAICSVCSKNWKNTVIKVCGHCFCLECAKDRLNARLRKCPLCNKQYSHNDLMTIHL